MLRPKPSFPHALAAAGLAAVTVCTTSSGALADTPPLVPAPPSTPAIELAVLRVDIATQMRRAHDALLLQQANARRAAATRVAAARAAAAHAAAEQANRKRRAEHAAADQAAADQAASDQAARSRRESSSRASRSRSTGRVSGSPRAIARSMLAARGQGDQFGCLDSLWSRESGWSVTASNGGSGAYGIPQALPGSKMSSAGGDWRTSAATQIRWGLGYIDGTYGSPCSAWQHSQSHNWY